MRLPRTVRGLVTALAHHRAGERRDWRFQPYRANGAPLPQVVVVPLTFTTSGLRDAPPAGVAATAPARPPSADSASSAPAVMTNSTIGGRSTTDFTTPDVDALTTATSQCGVAEDDAYGFAAVNAIKVGGGPRTAPRARDGIWPRYADQVVRGSTSSASAQ